MSNANVGKVFNMTGGSGGGGTLRLETLTITKPPQKTTYKSGESFDPTGMVVTAGYGYGLTSDVTGYSVSPQVLTDGVTEVVITYTEGRITKTASVPVTVQKVLVSIAVTNNPPRWSITIWRNLPLREWWLLPNSRMTLRRRFRDTPIPRPLSLLWGAVRWRSVIPMRV